MSLFHIHKWSKWTRVTTSGIRLDGWGNPVEYEATRQRRECEKCGLTKVRKVYG